MNECGHTGARALGFSEGNCGSHCGLYDAAGIDLARIQAAQIREYVAAARKVGQTHDYPGGPADLEQQTARALKFADDIDPLLSSDPLPEEYLSGSE